MSDRRHEPGRALAGSELQELRIRAYNVGFGDCLLLFFVYPDGERTILVDCGVHLSGVVNKMSVVVQDIVETVTRDGRPPRIDVVVATHRHFDHISGFDLNRWDDVEVGEVWMPWTEQRGHGPADSLRRQQQRMAAALAKRFPSIDTPIGWLAMNSMSNAGAEKTLLHGFAGNPKRRYLPDVDRSRRSFDVERFPGLRVHALGPSHDPEIIATLKPPEGKFFPRPDDDDAAMPIEDRPADDGPGDDRSAEDRSRGIFSPAHHVDGNDYARDFPRLFDRADTDTMDQRAADDYLGNAAALEDAINGTSLVLGLDLGPRCVLLGGDAEWGTWSEILADDEWTDVLERTLVYKVSHHGSYNGTPKPFVDDLLPPDAISVVSLCPMERWPSIPRTTLIDALQGDGRTLVRTDEIAEAPTRFRRKENLWIEVTVPLD